MKHHIEGSQAVAHAVALCRPEVMACYPISPQTHIVETLSRFFFNDTATTEIYTLSLHDALPISAMSVAVVRRMAAPSAAR